MITLLLGQIAYSDPPHRPAPGAQFENSNDRGSLIYVY